MTDPETCLECGGPLVQCTCRPDCPGGKCAVGCYLTPAERQAASVKLARAWLAQNELERGGPSITLANEYEIGTWYRAAIGQADYIRDLLDHRAAHLREITALRKALIEALDIADKHVFVPDLNPPATWSDMFTVDAGAPYRAKARIAELRKLVTP